jgi:outer membrane protein OmpA-like peptidoglycan-associated protein
MSRRLRKGGGWASLAGMSYAPRPFHAVLCLIAGAALFGAMPARAQSSAPKLAQVTVNPGAVEELTQPPGSNAPGGSETKSPEEKNPEKKAPAKEKAEKPEKKGTARKTAPAKPPAKSTAARPLPAPSPAAPSPTNVPANAPLSAAAPAKPGQPAPFVIPQTLDVPEAPPASPLLPPAAPAPPAHPNVPPPPPPVVASAVGEVLHVPGGTRLTFAPGSADLNPATDAALREIGAEVAKNPAEVVYVIAYASGPKDDPSTPRRLSLDRALAARAVLMQQGVPSTRIYVRALGTSATEGPADRVDLVVTTSTAAVAAAPPPPTPPPAPPGNGAVPTPPTQMPPTQTPSSQSPSKQGPSSPAPSAANPLAP